MSGPVRAQIELEVSSWIEGRGVRHTNWSVSVNDALVPVAELRDVQRTATDPELSFHDDEANELRVLPPGCQYRITYHLRLPIGARVQRRISTPLLQSPQHKHPPETTEGAFQRLMAAGYGQKLPLKTTFTEYRVTTRGLITEEQWQRRQQRARPNATATDTVSHADVEDFVRRLEKVG